MEASRPNQFNYGRRLTILKIMSSKRIKKIAKDAVLAEIFKKPGTEKILAKYNLPCLHCPMAKFELDKLTLGQVCQMYNLDLKKIIADLNNRTNSPRS